MITLFCSDILLLFHENCCMISLSLSLPVYSLCVFTFYKEVQANMGACHGYCLHNLNYGDSETQPDQSFFDLMGVNRTNTIQRQVGFSLEYRFLCPLVHHGFLQKSPIYYSSFWSSTLVYTWGISILRMRNSSYLYNCIVVFRSSVSWVLIL